jgi:hypothetical protein
MKKITLILLVNMFVYFELQSQCVLSCYNYSLSPVSFSVFPSAGVDAIPLFSPSIDDGLTPSVPLGFNFNFFCGTYSAVLVCSNGFLQFDFGSPANLAFANPSQFFPSPTSPNGLVALNMNDLDPNMGGSITYTTIGVSPNQMFILTYSNVPIWNYNTSLNTGQIILYETSNIIEIHSNSINASNTNIYTGTQGIESTTGTMGSAVPGRNSTLFQVVNSDAYRWTPIPTYTPAAPTNTFSGPTSLCQGTTGNYSITPSQGANSYNWIMPNGWVGTSSTTAMSATAGATGAISVTTSYSCGTSAPALYTVTTLAPPFISVSSVTPNPICSGNTSTITPAGAVSYTMMPNYINSSGSFTVMPSVASSYTIFGTGSNGCNSQNSALAWVNVLQTPTVTVNSGSVCLGQQFTFIANGANNYTYSTLFPSITPTAAGTYSCLVTGEASNGCGSEALGQLTVNPLPAMMVTATKNEICFKEKVTLTASGALSYSWSNSSTLTAITVTPLGTQQYSVTGYNEFGCAASKSITMVVNPCVGITESSLADMTTLVYPNPSEGIFNIKHIATEGAYNYELFDPYGRLIERFSSERESFKLDLENQAPGIYFLKANHSGFYTTHQLIKIDRR